MQEASQSSSLNLRIPLWTNSNGAKATLNGQSLSLPAPGVNTILVSLILFNVLLQRKEEKVSDLFTDIFIFYYYLYPFPFWWHCSLNLFTFLAYGHLTYGHIPSTGNFISVTKRWSSTDKLTIQLPINLRTEAIKGIHGAIVFKAMRLVTPLVAFSLQIYAWPQSNIFVL